mgnify:CR=1 FL=1
MARHVKPHDSVIGEVVNGEAVLLHLDTGKYFSLHPTGTRMWQLLGELGDVEQVASKLEAEFKVDPAVLRQDLAELIDTLLARGLATEQSC